MLCALHYASNHRLIYLLSSILQRIYILLQESLLKNLESSILLVANP